MIPISFQLDVCNAMYSEGKDKGSEADDEDSPMEVGHNIYILAYKLADHKKELRVALDKAEQQGPHDAVRHYAKHTAQIEVYMYMYNIVCACKMLRLNLGNDQGFVDAVLKFKIPNLKSDSGKWEKILACLMVYYD